jgi:biopolymer transport protein ExbD
MSKLRKLQAKEDEEPKMDMSPMIDMVFLLLIFFIVAAKIIKLKQDPDITVPLAKEGSMAQDNILGRIVVNIYEDGVIAGIDGRRADNSILEDEASIAQYIRERAEAIKARQYEPEIHLRGDFETEFKHVRKVTKAAAEAGIIKVVFASTERHVKKKGEGDN